MSAHKYDSWEKDGKTVVVPVRHGGIEGDATVEVTVEAMAELLTAAGFTRVTP